MQDQKTKERDFYVVSTRAEQTLEHRVRIKATSAREAALTYAYNDAVEFAEFSANTVRVFNAKMRPRGTFEWHMDFQGGYVIRLH